MATKEVLVQLRVTLPDRLGESGDEEQILDYVQSNLETDRWIAKAEFVIPAQLEQLILDNMPVPSTDESSQEPSSQDSQEPSSQDLLSEEFRHRLADFSGKVDLEIREIFIPRGLDFADVKVIVDTGVGEFYSEFVATTTPTLTVRHFNDKFLQMITRVIEKINHYAHVPKPHEPGVRRLDDELLGLVTDVLNKHASQEPAAEPTKEPTNDSSDDEEDPRINWHGATHGEFDPENNKRLVVHIEHGEDMSIVFQIDWFTDDKILYAIRDDRDKGSVGGITPITGDPGWFKVGRAPGYTASMIQASKYLSHREFQWDEWEFDPDFP